MRSPCRYRSRTANSPSADRHASRPVCDATRADGHPARGVIHNAPVSRRSDAFISYTRGQGEAVAADLHRFLTEHGFQLWQDRTHMRAGESFWAQIEAAIEHCEFLLMVVSSDAFRSDRDVLRNEWL